MSHTPVNKGGGKWFLRVCCGYDGTQEIYQPDDSA